MRKFVVFALIFFIDFVSKYWVAHHVPIVQPYLAYPFGGIGVFQTKWITFSIVHITNTGIAWGMLADFKIVHLVFRISIAAAITTYLVFFKPVKHLQIPLTMIAAGAFGNILDYFIYGHVIDMFYFILYKYSYPVFNVADASIFCAAVYLLCTSKKIGSRCHVCSS